MMRLQQNLYISNVFSWVMLFTCYTCTHTQSHTLLLNVLLIVSFKNFSCSISPQKNSHARRSYFENVTRLISLILKPSIHKIALATVSYTYFSFLFLMFTSFQKHKNLNTIIASNRFLLQNRQ